MRVGGLTGADAKLQQDLANFLLNVCEGINNNKHDEEILPNEIVCQANNFDEFISLYRIEYPKTIH